MANAIRSRTVQKGIDPREYTLVAFGGAGPLHGAQVAQMLGIPECIIPAYPGMTSAVGLLTTDVKYDALRTAFQVSTDVDYARLNTAFADMEHELRSQFGADGIDLSGVSFRRFADARYVGQGYELRLSVPDGQLDAPHLHEVVESFHAQHEQEYGHFFPDSPIEIVTLRLVGIGSAHKLSHVTSSGGGSLQAALIKTQQSVFRIQNELQSVQTKFYRREILPVGETFSGPAIIVQTDSTTVVPPDCSTQLDVHGNLLVRIGETQ